MSARVARRTNSDGKEILVLLVEASRVKSETRQLLREAKLHMKELGGNIDHIELVIPAGINTADMRRMTKKLVRSV